MLSLFSKPYTENSPQHTINQRFGNPRDTDSWCCTWGLGYLPWGTLRAYAVEENLNKELLEIGLLAQSKKDGSLYSPFENRLLIPITDHWNQTVGFAARRLTEDEHAPKYINSPTSPIFKKSDVLFGLAAGRREIGSSKTVYLVEGYTDVMRLYECGVYGAVARMGTALTDAQVALLKRIGARNVVIIPDNDTAGLNAANKDAMNLLRKGFAVSIAVLGEAGDDPDSFFLASQTQEKKVQGTRYEVPSKLKVKSKDERTTSDKRITEWGL